jgi:WD40 repeat protein
MLLRRVLVLVALLLSPATATAQPKDRIGDPLPAGAIARIGTTRLQLDREIQAVAVAPDGKRIAAISDSMLGVWEVPSGKQVLSLPWLRNDNVWPSVIGFTADGKSLVGNLRNQEVCMLDIGSGKVIRVLDTKGWLWHLGHDRRSLFVRQASGNASVEMIDRRSTANGALEQRWPFIPEPSLAASSYHLVSFLSRDDKLLAMHEYDTRKRQQLVRVHDAATGAEMRRWSAPWPVLRTLAFSDDGKLLAGLADDTVRLWDIGGDRELRSWTVQGGINTGRAALAFAPDGGSFFITDMTGIVRWDWRTGKRLQDYPDAGGPIAFLDGGKTIVVQGPIGALRLLDVATGKDLCPLPRAGDHVALAPDGRHIAWSEGGAVVLGDGSAKELRRWPAHEHFVGPLAFAPDGKTLASAGTDLRIQLWDVPSGRARRTLIRTGVQRLAFGADGRRLVTSGSVDVNLWDVESGKRLGWWYGKGEPPVMAPGVDVIAVPERQGQRLRLLEAVGGKELHLLSGYHPARAFAVDLPTGATMEPSYAPLPPTFSPGGQLLLTGVNGNEETGLDAIAVSEVGSGRRLATLDGATTMLNQMAFTPDSRLLTVMASNGRLQLLDARTGKLVRLLGMGAAPMTVAPIFTPDGRTLIAAIKDRVHIWEVASGGEIVCRSGHQDVVRALTMSADGRLLASGSADHTTLVWDMVHLAPRDTGSPDALWDDLAGADAVRGRRAVEALVAEPAQALALLAKRLAVAAPDPKRLARWLADLNSDDFDQRQEAERALDRLAELAGPALRQALATRPSAEARRRIENLLKKLDGPTLGASQRRAVRGVQVLEMIASAEARRVLAALVKAPAEARVASEARAALARLEKP